MADFFISYSNTDRDWAVWIAWHLEEAGYTTILQAWDFRPGSNFVLEMTRALVDASRVIAVLSPNYLSSRFTQPEWAAAFAQDPTGREGRLLPVRVEECEPSGLLPQIVYIDLVGRDPLKARDILLAGIQHERAKPADAPPFPEQVAMPVESLSPRRPVVGLALDSLDFGVSHSGMCVPPSGDWWTAERDPSRPTLSIALANQVVDRPIIVPGVEIRKLDVFDAISCTFPNDPTTGAPINTYESAVDLEDEMTLTNVLGAHLVLRPGESNALKVAFGGAPGRCYRIQLRCLWKYQGGGSFQSVLSDPYLINFAQAHSTWQREAERALAAGEQLSVQLANGWRSLDDFLARQPTSRPSIRFRKLEHSSMTAEFILLGSRAAIIPEIPPRDRWIEQFNYNRKGLIMDAPEVVAQCLSASESTELGGDLLWTSK